VLQKEISLLEERLEVLIKEHESEMLTNISSIAGIGKKTAMILIATTFGSVASVDDYSKITTEIQN
jgi:transposase